MKKDRVEEIILGLRKRINALERKLIRFETILKKMVALGVSYRVAARIVDGGAPAGRGKAVPLDVQRLVLAQYVETEMNPERVEKALVELSGGDDSKRVSERTLRRYLADLKNAQAGG